MIIIGGTYTEICFEPIWENIYGSGFRAVSLILETEDSQEIEYFTCSDDEVKAHLEYYHNLYPRLTINSKKIFKNPIFYYDHPLKTPSIFPRPDLYNGINICLEATGNNILAYGVFEASIKVEGKMVVYDPQSPVNPKSFSSTGSKAEQLITIINYAEAEKITGSRQLSDIVDYFFNKEKCYALIIKMGAKGAHLFEAENGSVTKVPVYKTNRVWPIGSGDVFSAYFAYNWFKNRNLAESAILASKAAAAYCNTMDLSETKRLNSITFSELTIDEIPHGQIYLAGPFFTYSERWLVNEVRNTLKDLGLRVFSPFHDVGHGKAEDVVDKDLKGLDYSDIVFAIVDGLDSGTLFEVGYAISQKKKIVAFVQNEDEESLKMLKGTNCIIEKDLTTAIYKTYWALASS